MAPNNHHWLRTDAYLFCNSLSRKEHLANGGQQDEERYFTYGNLKIHIFIFVDGKLQLLTPSGGGKPMAPVLHFSKDTEKAEFNHTLRNKILQMLQPGANMGNFKDVKIVDDNFDTPLVLRRGNEIEDETWEGLGLRPLETAVLVTVGSSSNLSGEIVLNDLAHKDVPSKAKLWSIDLPPLDREAAHQARRDGQLSDEILPADIDVVFDRLETK